MSLRVKLKTRTLQIIKHFIEEVNLLRKERRQGPVSWSTAVKFLCARKFDVARAVALYDQHEATRDREGLIDFDPNVEPLKSELDTAKFTILVSIFDGIWILCMSKYPVLSVDVY